MECFRCRERYDEELRRPKLLPCGDVFCGPCLKSADRCFSDGEAFSKTVDELPDDLYTLGLLRIPPPESEDAPDSAGVLSLWCATCSAAAGEACLDSQDDADRAHVLHSMTRHRHEVLLRHLENMLAVLEKPNPAADRHDDEVMTQLASSGEVEVSYDGVSAEGLSAKVQLGGSCAEDTDVAWAVQQLLLSLPEDVVPKPVPQPPAKDDDGGLGFGLFDADADVALFADDEDDNDESKSAMLGLMEQDAEEDDEGDELDLSPVRDPHLDSKELAKVRRIVNLSCKMDPPRTLKLLDEVAPFLEELQMVHVDRAHLLATLRMPKLWRLEAFGVDICSDPFVVPAALPHDGGLRVLQASLSAPTVASLALAHQRTLEHVLIVPPMVSNKDISSRVFGDLDYRGGGKVAMPGFKRNPYFPTRRPGQFPVLKSIEFDPTPSGLRNSTPAIAALQDMYPGVHVGSPKSIVGWGAAIKARLRNKTKEKQFHER
ncbi:uncharacterized protein LOC117647259 [Thrips palmi]|uniref:Uncharacterized protein LOC117647259 n=1 Tax=Thrips palmi TaxID=161013 RepID=A0A6P8Z438_THRPL|nr:uncharacterized protein LOC117647259 [Thrips palmi]XP_034244840.1 uncharacterized protein LOC117647259 [Thrips palmi]